MDEHHPKEAADQRQQECEAAPAHVREGKSDRAQDKGQDSKASHQAERDLLPALRRGEIVCTPHKKDDPPESYECQYLRTDGI